MSALKKGFDCLVHFDLGCKRFNMGHMPLVGAHVCHRKFLIKTFCTDVSVFDWQTLRPNMHCWLTIPMNEKEDQRLTKKRWLLHALIREYHLLQQDFSFPDAPEPSTVFFALFTTSARLDTAASDSVASGWDATGLFIAIVNATLQDHELAPINILTFL